jgi:predicted amidohydrolase
MAAKGATMLFIPTNNGVPRDRDRSGLTAEARVLDVAHATRHHLWVVRADIVGDNGALISDGASGIVDPGGRVVAAPSSASPQLLVAATNMNVAL